jgi:hypothetical protein
MTMPNSGRVITYGYDAAGRISSGLAIFLLPGADRYDHIELLCGEHRQCLGTDDYRGNF